MYCIKVNVSTEKYVRSCDSGSFRLCERKSDAKKFASLEELLTGAACAGLRDDDFEVVSTDVNKGKESAVFGRSGGYVLTFARLFEICEEGSADMVLKPGDKLEMDYVIAAVKPDAVKIWSPDNSIGYMNWAEARQAAANFCYDWNIDGSLPVEVISTELLSKEESESMSKNDRIADDCYWTSTEDTWGGHYGVSTVGSWFNSNDNNSYECCPAIWVGAHESSEDSDEEQEDVITFERLHEICEEGSADLVLKPGDKVENDYVVVAVMPDAVKIWSVKDCLGEMSWIDANTVAAEFSTIWNNNNSGLPIEAISSGLLSKEEVEDLSQSDRTTDFDYWTSTECSSYLYWFVSSNGSLYYSADSDSRGCCPGLWVG